MCEEAFDIQNATWKSIKHVKYQNSKYTLRIPYTPIVIKLYAM
jgi:hypothetical protein